MNSTPIKPEQDHSDVSRGPENWFDAVPNAGGGDEIEILGILIDCYENVYFPIDL